MRKTFSFYKLYASLCVMTALMCFGSIEVKAQNKIITDFPIVENFFLVISKINL